MVPRLSDEDPPLVNRVHKAMLIRDVPGPETGQVVPQGIRFAQTTIRFVLNVLDQTNDPCRDLASLPCAPLQVPLMLPSIGNPDLNRRLVFVSRPATPGKREGSKGRILTIFPFSPSLRSSVQILLFPAIRESTALRRRPQKRRDIECQVTRGADSRSGSGGRRARRGRIRRRCRRRPRRRARAEPTPPISAPAND